MQLIPDQKSAKTTAIMLLVIAVLLVYLLCFHWFIQSHREYNSELSDLREQLGRFQAVAEKREVLQTQLAELKNSQEDTSLFLDQPGFDEAAADLSSRLGSMVRDQNSEDCQIVSRQPVRARVQERFVRVTVNVRMRCDAEGFADILYEMETSTPLMLVDDLNIIRPRTQRRSRGVVVELSGPLDIRFNVSGYLK
jgi:general secretion pathway protein M